MGQLMNKIIEIKELKDKYNLQSHETTSLQLLAIFEENKMTYEKMKVELIKIHKEKNYELVKKII